MRMREKIIEYTPIVKWVSGKTHYNTDALSRSPMFDTNEEEYTISCNYQIVQSAWDCIKQGTKSTHYAALQKVVETGEPNVEISQFKTLLHQLSLRRMEDVDMVVLDSTRLVVPTGSQKTVLTELHRAHSGITKTYATATQLYYWPGMKNCIKTFLSRCATCQKYSATQARTPVTGTAPSAAGFPMINLGMDLFDDAKVNHRESLAWIFLMMQEKMASSHLPILRLCLAVSTQKENHSIYSANFFSEGWKMFRQFF